LHQNPSFFIEMLKDFSKPPDFHLSFLFHCRESLFERHVQKRRKAHSHPGNPQPATVNQMM